MKIRTVLFHLTPSATNGAIFLLLFSIVIGSKKGRSQTPDMEPYEELEHNVIRIFAKSCARTGCHGGSAPQQGMSLTENNFKAHTVNASSQERPRFNLVEPGKPDSSYLYMKVTGAEDIVGAKMPLTGGELSDHELENIKRWIEKLPGREDAKLSSAGKATPKYAHPFDGWSTINTPTNRMVDKGKWLFLIGHRFNPKITSGYDQLYGLDGGANILLSMGYALTNNTLVNLGRSRINGAVNAQIKHRFLRQTLDGKIPVDIAALGTLNWASSTTASNRWDNRLFTYSAQVSVTREIINGVGVTISPGITYNPDIDRENEDPMITMGLGGRWRFHRNLSLIGEWNPILEGYSLTNTSGNFNRFDSWGTGVEIAVGGHIFQIFLTNSFGTTTAQYLRGGDLDIRNEGLRLGFNIYRVLNL